MGNTVTITTKRGAGVSMMNNNEFHRRKFIRMKDYDYAQSGLYFITICTQNRSQLFGHIDNNNLKTNKIELNDARKTIEDTWTQLPRFYEGIKVDIFQIMPNHIHGIIEISDEKLMALSEVVRRFKTLTTNRYIDGVQQNKWKPFCKKLWQRNYYEHIIRNPRDYLQIAEYILNNPTSWHEDEYYEMID